MREMMRKKKSSENERIVIVESLREDI